MFLILIMILLTIIFITIQLITNEIAWSFGWIITGSVIFCMICAFPINYLDTKESISKFNATKTSIISLRKTNDNFEKAALQQKIIEQNQWLSVAKYYRNNFFFKDWIPKEIDKLTPIE
jgi:hypothetical protein